MYKKLQCTDHKVPQQYGQRGRGGKGKKKLAVISS